MLNYAIFVLSPVVIEALFLFFVREPISYNNTNKKRFLIIMGAILFFYIAFRSGSVGTIDNQFYLRNWNVMSRVPPKFLGDALEKIDIERGYLISVWLLSKVFRWNQWLFIFCGILTSVSICRFLYKNVNDVCLGFVMFSNLGLFAFMVQGVRQGIAICICLYALEMSKRRKIIRFVLLVLLASTFHASALVFLLVYLLPLLKMNWKSIAIFAVLTLMAFLFMDKLLDFGNFLINDDYSLGDTKDAEGGGYISLLIYFLIITASIVFADWEEKHMSLFFFFTACGMITFFMRFVGATVLQRISYFFILGQTVLLSRSLSRFRLHEWQRILIRELVVALCLGIGFYKASYSVLIPYTFFWQ